MDEENPKSWAEQPDVCRCCLSASGTWDLTASYISEAGIKEVYSDMLQECFGISLSCLSDWGPSHLVCEMCVNHLREAHVFRKQVLKAEICFVEHFNRRNEQTVIKTELTLEDTHPFEDNDHFDDYNINDMLRKFQNQQKHKISIKTKERRTKKRQKSVKNRSKKKKEMDYDSDAPIAELSKKIKPSYNRLKDDCDTSVNSLDEKLKQLVSDLDLKTELEKSPQYGVKTKEIKKISERKRVRLTCATVLKDTTACPFRHHKSWFQCFYCTQEFMSMTVLRDHNKENHENVENELRKMKRYPRSLQIDISNLQCRHCNVTLTDVECMRRHFESVHGKAIYNECIADYKVNSSPYTCHLCQQEFHVFRTLTTHLNEHYANCICDVCGRSFINSKRLKVHKRTHESGQFPCSECGKILVTKTSKANHMESAHSKRQLKCQICLKPMKHYNDRIKHMSEEHNITHMFKCTVCSKEFNIKHYLATHMRQTHGNKNKKCLECGMAFITNHGLKKHMFKHTGVKPHKCNVCGKAYARSYTLREHMRAHEGDRRFLITA